MSGVGEMWGLRVSSEEEFLGVFSFNYRLRSCVNFFIYDFEEKDSRLGYVVLKFYEI